MLILSRKPEESIMIDSHIEIKVLGMRGDRVVLGIHAPPEMKILRGELNEDEILEDEYDDGEEEL